VHAFGDVRARVRTLLRAWSKLSSFKGRGALRSWLYSIATNVCLRLIERRPGRVLPVDYGPAAEPHTALAAPVVESTWIEPLADHHRRSRRAARSSRSIDAFHTASPSAPLDPSRA
jgi:DNA-directed RNA polymerase specialized sigma24 family protein